MHREELLAKTYSFLSYLFREEPPIKRLFLFGSVARGDFDEESDIDLFLEVGKKDEKRTKRMAEKALQRFYKIEGEKWKYRGTDNPFSLKFGPLEEWKLKNSIEREGIALYASVIAPDLKKYLLFTIRPIKPLKKRIRVVRKLFGREGYQEKGMVGTYHGKILDPRTFIVSADGLKEITYYLAKEKVEFRFEEIWK